MDVSRLDYNIRKLVAFCVDLEIHYWLFWLDVVGSGKGFGDSGDRITWKAAGWCCGQLKLWRVCQGNQITDKKTQRAAETYDWCKC